MKFLRSLHARILFGYCVVGGLFVVLVANALVQFRHLEEELASQQQVVAFYDAVRHARRLEKNFLLYRRPADLVDAGEQAESAVGALAAIPLAALLAEPDRLAAQSTYRYRDLLHQLIDSSGAPQATPALQEELYTTGSHLLKLGERLDAAARRKVEQAVQRHDSDLLNAIWAALVLAIATGVLVTRSVVRPLRDIEHKLQKVAKGEAGRIDGREAAGEVESLTRSINDTLQEIETRQTSLARSSRLMALGTMLSGVAHELNNPLSNISSSCQILLEEWRELPPPETGRLLAQIDDQTLRAQRIVGALLDFSRSQPLQRRCHEARELVEEALALVRHHIPDSVHIRVEAANGVEVDVDRLRFQQVLVNMLRNAAEAIAGEGTIAIQAWREQFPEGHGTTFEIEDDGEGIAETSLKRIFDPFYTTKPVGKGTGLGLFVAHEIVTQHGGMLSVESKPGEGTRFWIHIPDRQEEENAHG